MLYKKVVIVGISPDLNGRISKGLLGEGDLHGAIGQNYLYKDDMGIWQLGLEDEICTPSSKDVFTYASKVLLVYDVSLQETFDALMPDIKRYLRSNDVPNGSSLLLGYRKKEADFNVTEEAALELAAKLECEYLVVDEMLEGCFKQLENQINYADHVVSILARHNDKQVANFMEAMKDPFSKSGYSSKTPYQNSSIFPKPNMKTAKACPQTLTTQTIIPSSPHLLPPTKSSESLNQEEMKKVAAFKAAEMVKSNMVVGLGTGSTATHFIDRLADLINSGSLKGIIGIPTSKKTESHAINAKIPLSTLDLHPIIDISIDGADEVDPEFNLVKGRGGSLFREKMIEGASRKFVIIVDESKMVDRLGGSGLSVPVEIVPFSCNFTLLKVKELFEGELGFRANLRMNGEKPFETDNENYIIEMFFERGVSGDLNEVSDRLLRITGVIDHGMFLDMATCVVMAKKDGSVEILNK